jgi:hypothetical protein
MAGEPEKIGSFEYIATGTLTPVALCANCERRYALDPTRHLLDGEPIANHFFESEEARKPVCDECRSEAFGEALQETMMEVLEEKLGLAEKDRDALRTFIQTIFTDPEKILKLERVNNRLESLEREVSTWKWVSGITAGVAISALILAVTALAASS